MLDFSISIVCNFAVDDYVGLQTTIPTLACFFFFKALVWDHTVLDQSVVLVASNSSLIRYLQHHHVSQYQDVDESVVNEELHLQLAAACQEAHERLRLPIG